MSETLMTLVGLAKRAGRLAAGEEPVAAALAEHKARLLLAAAVAAEGTVRRAQRDAGDRVALVCLREDKAALGGALGWESCALAAVTEAGFAASIAREAAREAPEYAPLAQQLEQARQRVERRKKKKPRNHP